MVDNFGNLTRQLRPIFALLVVSLLLLGNTISIQAATPINGGVGYRDHNFPSGVGSNSEVTAEKPESKLWWNDGFWWASMWSSAGNAYHIYKLDWATQNWSDTGTELDDRKDSKADVLWDDVDQKLYVTSHIWTKTGSAADAGERGEMFRYSYSGGTYTLDSGFPVEVSGGTSEALVMEKDSSGMLWVTYVQDSKVYVNHSQNDDDADWVGPYVLPVGSDAEVSSDDLASVIAYTGKIGIMWSNQSSRPYKMFFAVHTDGADPDTWQSVATTDVGDDHINLKSLQSAPSGNVFAAVKTGSNLLLLLVCHSGTCTSASNWSIHTVYSKHSPTRPQILIDTSHNEVYYFARVSDNIYYKRSDLSTIEFADGDGEPFIKIDPDIDAERKLNDPTTTKQNVNNTTGIVVMASDRQTRYYFHNCLELSGSSEKCLAANPAPNVYFDSAAYQVSEAGGSASITVKLSEQVAGQVKVDYTTQNGSAVAGSDYTTKSGTLTFDPGEPTTQTIDVAILNNTDPESDESFTLKLSNANGIDLGSPDTTTVKILDNDTPPEVMFGINTYVGAEDSGSAVINIVLSAASDSTVTVDYSTSDKTATAGADYQSANGKLTFAPGDTSESFSVPILNDVLDEQNELVDLTLANPSNAIMGSPASAILAITDNDPAPSVSIGAPTYAVGEQEGSLTVPVNLNAASGQTVSVTYKTGDGTAEGGKDYTSLSDVLTFSPGEISKNIIISINNDLLNEVAETFTLALSSPANAALGSPQNTTIMINDNDPIPAVGFSNASFSAVEDVDAEIMITVELSSASGQTVSVKYATSGNTATEGSDFEKASGTMTFNPGQTSNSFKVKIKSDDVKEGSETIDLTLSDASNSTLVGGISAASLTIIDDEVPPEANFSTLAYKSTEDAGPATVTVRLNRSADQQITVDYWTANGTAKSGSDYTATSGTLIFPAGQTSRSFHVSLINDKFNESDETISLSLGTSVGATLGSAANATLTIIDDDRPTISFGDGNYAVYGSAGTATIDVLLSKPALTAVTVNYITSDGNATAGSDSGNASGTVTFEPGVTRKIITIPIIAGTSNTTPKTINLQLTNPQNAILGAQSTTVLKILDNAMIYLSFLSG